MSWMICEVTKHKLLKWNWNEKYFTMSSVSQDLPSADSFMAWGQAHTKPDLDEL